MKKWMGLLFMLLMIPYTAQAAGAALPFGDNAVAGTPVRWGALNAHDPAIFKDGDTYYAFSTDASRGDLHRMGAQIRKSQDLIHWTYVGPAFAHYRDDCAAEIKHGKLNPDKHNGLWAPDVIKVGDTYRMYYSASTFGSSRSCIGLAEADSIEGPYTDKGIVVKSDANALNGPNCIDPALIVDREGTTWMSYGSFFGGIFMAKLGADGFFAPDAEPVRIAGSRGSSVEGSYIVYLPETDFYYLFVSYGSLSADYNVRVARSRDVTGPYLDANGRDMKNYATLNAARVGTKLLGGIRFGGETRGVKAPGHCSVLKDGDDLFLVHHQRAYGMDTAWFGMSVRRMALNAFGWPVVLPMAYAGEAFEPLAQPPRGAFELIEQGGDNNENPHTGVVVTLDNGLISGACAGSYRVYDGYRLEVTFDGALYDGVIARQTDAETGAEGLAFSVSGADGLSLLAFRHQGEE